MDTINVFGGEMLPLFLKPVVLAKAAKPENAAAELVASLDWVTDDTFPHCTSTTLHHLGVQAELVREHKPGMLTDAPCWGMLFFDEFGTAPLTLASEAELYQYVVTHR